MRTKTLEEIIRAEQTHRHESGQFGIDACKDSIRFSVEHLGSNLADLLNEYVERANTDAFFNKAMVLACWELMQEEKAKTSAEESEAKYELVIVRANGTEEVIHRDLTEREAIAYFEGIENTYYREQKEESKTMKNYIGRRGENADRINAVIEAYEATRDGKTADTVARLVESLGRAGAAEAVATVVNAVSPHDGRISDRVREWVRFLDLDVPSNAELRADCIYGVDSWIHSAHVDGLASAMIRYLKETPTEEETAEAEAETAPKVCEGCRFFDACGDADRVEPCEGFEIAPKFDDGHDILKAETFGQSRDLMRALHRVYGFDFCAPYFVGRIDGRYTVNKIRKAVEAVAPLYAVNRYGFRVVALCAVDYPRWYSGRLYAVEITADGFDIDGARGVNRCGLRGSNAFDNCYKKGEFDELRKNDTARCIIVAQASEHLRPIWSKNWGREDLIEIGERYRLIAPKTYRQRANDSQTYYSGAELQRIGGEATKISHSAPTRGGDCYTDLSQIIDKSGYLIASRRLDLQRRADERRAEKKRRAYEATENGEKVETLRAIIGAKRHALALELEKATTYEAIEAVSKKMRRYPDGFMYAVQDFERFEKRTASKDYPSIEASEKAYNAILTALMA